MSKYHTLEQIREFIACPELGDDHYGKWGAMTREQRLVMNDLIELAKKYYASFIGIELDKKYFEIAKKRIEDANEEIC